MTSKSSRSVFSTEEYKSVLADASLFDKPDSERGHIYTVNELLPRPVWFKGSRDRGFREDIAA
tara:strand:- start:1360 stop:1548 length:189 start_codon:yes stop_codon:yes gene_type:complete